MKNSGCWCLRFAQLEAAQNRKGAEAYAEIERQYRRVQKEIEGKIDAWYRRFASNNGVSIFLDGYCRTAYEIQKGTGIGFDIAGLDQDPQKAIDNIARKMGNSRSCGTACHDGGGLFQLRGTEGLL